MKPVDLRPMTLGEVLDRTFSLYKNNFLLFAGIVGLPHLVTLLYQFLQLTMASSTARAVNRGSIGSTIGSVFVSVLVMGVVQAATVTAVSDIYLGKQASIGESYRRSWAKALTVIGVILLSFLAIGVGFILLVIPGIYLACRLAVAVPACVAEDDSAVSSMERSMDLTKGHAMPMFLILLLVGLLTWVVTILLQSPIFFTAIKAASGGATRPVYSIGMLSYSILAGFLGQVLVGPIGTIATVLMYYNLRVKKEGFDIQHMLGTLGTPAAPLTPGN